MKLTALVVTISVFLLVVNELKYGEAAPANEDLVEVRRLVNAIEELLREDDEKPEVRKTVREENHPADHPVARTSLRDEIVNRNVAENIQNPVGLQRRDDARDMLARLLAEISGETRSETENEVDADITEKSFTSFGLMVEHMVDDRSSLQYTDYGCYCGKGNMGDNIVPVDGVDECCRVHDNCWGTFERECAELSGTGSTSGGMLTYYKWDYEGSGLKCSEPDEYSFLYGHRECRKQLCECDKAAAICFSQNEFNDDYKDYVKRGLFKREEGRCTDTLP